MIQLAWLAEAQEHCVPVIIVIVFELCVDGSENVVGETLYVQLLAPWVTVIVWPATMSVPVRVPPEVFAATTNTTDPMPVPLAPDCTVIQLAWLVAVHEHCVPVIIVIVFELCVDPTENVVGETL